MDRKTMYHHHPNAQRSSTSARRPVVFGSNIRAPHQDAAVEGEIPLSLPGGGAAAGGATSNTFAWRPATDTGSPLLIGQQQQQQASQPPQEEGGAKTDPTVATSFVESTRLGRAGWIGLCMAFVLFLAAVAALIAGVLLWRNAELSAGPIGPVGPQGPQGPPGNVTVNGSNPFNVGDVIFSNPENTTVLDINGSLKLPLSLWHMDGDNVTVFESVPNPGPGTDPLFCIDAPGGLCVQDPVYLDSNFMYGPWQAPDCPDFEAGLQLGQAASFLKTDTPTTDDVTLQAADDLFLCTAGGSGTANLNVGCSPRGPVELGEVQTVLALDEDACLEWEPGSAGPFGDSGICHNGTCAQVKEDCLVFDGTAISFEGGAFIDGDLFVSGNLSYTNTNMFNISQVNGDFTVTDGCLFADCVVTDNLTVGNQASYSFGTSWTQAAGGSWTQQSAASFENNVEVVGPAIFDMLSGAVTVYNSGASSVYQSGSTLSLDSFSALVVESNVTATCDAPLFTNSSGCVDCDVVVQCLNELELGVNTTRVDRYVMPSGSLETVGPGFVATPVDLSVLSSNTPNTLGSSFDGTAYTLPALAGVYTFTYSVSITDVDDFISHFGVALTTSEHTVRIMCSHPAEMINLGTTKRGITCTHTGYLPASAAVTFNLMAPNGTATFERGEETYVELSLAP